MLPKPEPCQIRILSVLSHELRTRLTSWIGYGELSAPSSKSTTSAKLFPVRADLPKNL